MRGFLAFGLLLDQHPELAGQVSFLALLQPSRTDVTEYGDYISTIGAVVAEVNARHTASGRQPIDLRLVEDFALAVGAYSICDVIMVNALADGMNLVAKEVAVVNQRNGVLALSENAGAFEELGEYAVPLYPFDVQQMADALYEALTMPEPERKRLLAGRCRAGAEPRRGCLAAGPAVRSRGAGRHGCTGSPHRPSGSLGAGHYRQLWRASVASSSGHVKASPGAWVSVTLVVIAFILGTFALIVHSVPLWIATGVVMVAGIAGGFASRIMDQAY